MQKSGVAPFAGQTETGKDHCHRDRRERKEKRNIIIEKRFKKKFIKPLSVLSKKSMSIFLGGITRCNLKESRYEINLERISIHATKLVFPV